MRERLVGGTPARARRQDANVELGGLLRDALPVGCDVRDSADRERLVAAALDRYGRIDILVNNAGIAHSGPAEDEPLDVFRDQLETNTVALFALTQLVARHMLERRSGSIINIASPAATVNLDRYGLAAYAASKAAVVALTRIAAKELGPHGITVNAVCPGYVLTEMGAATRTAEQVAAWTALSPLGRLATPDDVADVVLFLASDQASYGTGQALNVTGGIVMH